MYSKLKSTICAQFAKKRSKCSTLSNSAFPERRQQDRRQRRQDRRHQTILRSQVRFDRRSNLHGQVHNSHIEFVNAQFDPAHSLVERNDSLFLGVVTERADLIAWLQTCSERLPATIHPFYFEQLEERYDGLKDSRHNLILIDTALSNAVVIEQMQKIRRSSPASVKIILLYDRILPDLIKEIVECSVSGLLQTGINQELFLKAIHAVHKGEYWFPHQLTNRLLDFIHSQWNHSASLKPGSIVFTGYEQKVVDLLVKGLTNKQIAQRLAISPETVKSHLKNIFNKANVQTRSQLVAFYFLMSNKIE